MANKDNLVKKLAESNEGNVIIQIKDDYIGRSVTQEISTPLNNPRKKINNIRLKKEIPSNYQIIGNQLIKWRIIMKKISGSIVAFASELK
jgi:hypothetical protein